MIKIAFKSEPSITNKQYTPDHIRHFLLYIPRQGLVKTPCPVKDIYHRFSSAMTPYLTRLYLPPTKE